MEEKEMEKIMNEIKNQTEDIQIPKELLPENMMETIKKDKVARRNRMMRRWVAGGTTVLAASLALAISIKSMNQTTPAHSLEESTTVEASSEETTKKTEENQNSENTTAPSKETTSENQDSTPQGGTQQEEKTEHPEVTPNPGVDTNEVVNANPHGLHSFNSYKEIEQAAKKGLESLNRFNTLVNDEEIVDSPSFTLPSIGATVNKDVSTNDSPAPEGQVDYTGTNVQVEGVAEADIVKTDGNYLYIFQSSTSKIQIYSLADAKKPAKVSEINLKSRKEWYTYAEMYVSGDNLVVVRTSGDETIAMTYNIADRKNPTKIGYSTFSGTMMTSRLIGDVLYVFSYQGGRYFWADEGLVYPVVNEKKVACEDIYAMDIEEYNTYVNMNSININYPAMIIDSMSILTDYSEVYVNTENVFLFGQDYADEKGEKDGTILNKIAINNGKFTAIASGKVDGFVKDSFAINEKDGYLRILTSVSPALQYSWDDENWFFDATTAEPDTNSVYVLDQYLNQVGQIEGIAPDERIYAARFNGNTGYFVTYRETDPVFAVDFSNPSNPVILGELKITGFSEYLHFWSDNLMVGIGENADKNGNVNGIKISMFDISDPTNMREISKKVIRIKYFDASRLDDYKSILVDPEKNVLGFSYTDYSSDKTKYKYKVFSYSLENGFEEVVDHTGKNKDYWGDECRGIRVNNNIYVVYPDNYIATYSLISGRKYSTVKLSSAKKGKREFVYYAD